MKQPSRNKALLAQLKKAREHLPADAHASEGPATTDSATESAPSSPASASTASPAPTPTSTPVPAPVATAAPASASTTESVPADDATRASQAFGVVPPPAATDATTENTDANSDWPPALERHTAPGQWSRRNLLATLAASLPPDFPEISFGAEVLCPRGVYHSVQRSRSGSAARLSTPGGTREFTPIRTSATYQNWLKHFTRHRSPDPQRDAVRLCCAELVTHLESFEDYQREHWTKTIDPTAWAPLETA